MAQSISPKIVVPREGLEPPRLAAVDFESTASTIPPPGQQRTRVLAHRAALGQSEIGKN